MSTILPTLTTLVTLVFAGLVLFRYASRPRPYLLVWGIGLTLYGIATGAEAFATLAWHPLAFRLWYLGGALLTAAWLGQGTIFLLARKQYIANFLLWLLVFASLVAANEMFHTPLAAERYVPGQLLSVQYQALLPPDALVRKLTPFFNIYGMLGLVGGAIYSAWLFWRKRGLPYRLVGSILFALGGLLPGLGGTLGRFGLEQFLAPSQFIGVLLLFAGYWFSTLAPKPRPVEQALPAAEPVLRKLPRREVTAPAPDTNGELSIPPGPAPEVPALPHLPDREPLIIERDGRPVAALVSLEEYREFVAWRAGRRPDRARYTLRRGEDIIDGDDDLLALIQRGSLWVE